MAGGDGSFVTWSLQKAWMGSKTTGRVVNSASFTLADNLPLYPAAFGDGVGAGSVG